MYVHVNVCLYVCEYMGVCVPVCTCMCMHVWMHGCVVKANTAQHMLTATPEPSASHTPLHPHNTLKGRNGASSLYCTATHKARGQETGLRCHRGQGDRAGHAGCPLR